MENEMPRANQIDKNTPAELVIRAAMAEVEKIGADVRLTDATCMLEKARILVADFIDNKS